MNTVYEELAVPYFQDILAKHSLTTNLSLTIDTLTLSPSPCIKEGDITVIIKAKPDACYTYTLNPTKTNLGKYYMDKIRAKCAMPEDKFTVGNYGRSKPKLTIR